MQSSMTSVDRPNWRKMNSVLPLKACAAQSVYDGWAIFIRQSAMLSQPERRGSVTDSHLRIMLGDKSVTQEVGRLSL